MKPLATVLSMLLPAVLMLIQPAPGPTPDPAPPPTEYAPDFEPLRFIGALSNGNDNWQPRWESADPGVLTELLNAQDGDRVVLRQLSPEEGWVAFSSWWTLTKAQRDLFRAEVSAWKGEAIGRQIGVYFRWQSEYPFRHDGDERHPDPDDPTAMRWWNQNMAELAPLVDEVWLDGGSASSSPAGQRAVARMAAWCREHWGITVGVEAIPFARGDDGVPDPALGPDWEYLREVPAMALWRYIWLHAIQHPDRHEAWRVPEGLEVHVLLEPGRQGAPDPTAADVALLDNLGYVLSYVGAPYEPGPDPDPSRRDSACHDRRRDPNALR